MTTAEPTEHFSRLRVSAPGVGAGQAPQRLEIPERLRSMLGPVQTAQIARELAAEHFQDPAAVRGPTGDLLARQAAQLSRMPTKFTEATADRLALARYTERARAWYVLACDADATMAQCLLVARDVAEVGYISLQMLTATNVPMDLQYGAEPLQAVFQRHGIELPNGWATTAPPEVAAKEARAPIRRRMH